MERLKMNNPFSTAPVYYRNMTDSTMDDAKTKAGEQIDHGSVFRTSFQRKGRGRVGGRKWESTRGENLMFTLVLKKDLITQSLHHIPLLLGVALAETVKIETSLECKVKWPNDLLCCGKKVSGILVEASGDYLYCGIGINCNQTIFDDKLKDKASSLFILSGEEVDMDKFLIDILENIKTLLDSGKSWHKKLSKILYKKNDLLEVLEGGVNLSEKVRGINLGIGDDGQLLIEGKNGHIYEIYTGEIEI